MLLEAARSDAPYARFELLDTTFQMADVVGRRIQLAFPPPLTVEQLLGLRLKDVQAVAPVMAVVGDDMTAEDRARLVSSGDVLTFSGDVWGLGADGGVVRNRELAALPSQLDPLDSRVRGVVDQLLEINVELTEEELLEVLLSY